MSTRDDPQRAFPSDALEALSAPLGDLIAAVGRGVADAQRALDAATIASLRELDRGTDESTRVLRHIGYQPTWYRIPKVEAEITVSLSIVGHGGRAEGGQAGDGRLRLYATPVDATYTNMYEYDLRATSKLRFTIVPVPPNAELKIVPEVANRAYEDAVKELDARGITHKVVGAQPDPRALVLSSTPAAGAAIQRDEVVELRFTR